MKSVNPEILVWIDEQVLPCYDAFDKGHQRDHALYVMRTAIELSEYYEVDVDVVAVAAACHDLGLAAGRDTHHLESGKIIRNMAALKRWFDPQQIETIAQAAEDHRASSKEPPRTIYGKIVAEADRQIVPEVVIRRAIQFGLKNCPALGKNEQWHRTVSHLKAKYAAGGYLKLWIPESSNAAKLNELRAIIENEAALRNVFETLYKEECGK